MKNINTEYELYKKETFEPNERQCAVLDAYEKVVLDVEMSFIKIMKLTALFEDIYNGL